VNWSVLCAYSCGGVGLLKTQFTQCWWSLQIAGLSTYRCLYLPNHADPIASKVLPFADAYLLTPWHSCAKAMDLQAGLPCSLPSSITQLLFKMAAGPEWMCQASHLYGDAADLGLSRSSQRQASHLGTENTGCSGARRCKYPGCTLLC